MLGKNFRQYLETVMLSKKIIKMETQKTTLQKTYQMSIGQESIYIDFLGVNRQFDWVEFSLVYDKSDKHTTIYGSYNHELAAKQKKSVRLSNFT